MNSALPVRLSNYTDRNKICNTKFEKLKEIKFDDKVNFNKQVSNLRQTGSNKLHKLQLQLVLIWIMMRTREF